MMYWDNRHTICSAQSQTNFTNTLIQDITIFTGNEATQLEDWLLDIETTANLSAESRTKLAQAKSRGLTHTLITEALTSGKSWEDIKDLLHLKVCNSNIHTSVSHFYGDTTEGKGIFSSLFTSFQEGNKEVQFYKKCSNNKDIHKRAQECPHHSHSSLWERTTHSSRHHLWSRETLSSTATNSYLITCINSKCNVSWGRLMFPVSWARSYSMTLSKCMIFWMQWILSYSRWTVHIGYHHQAHLHVTMDRIPTPGTTPDQLLDTINRTDTDIEDRGCRPALKVIAVTVVTTPIEDVPAHIIEIVDATI